MTTSKHWLDAYANGHHAWHTLDVDEETSHVRRLGVLETAFEIDGADYEGRADLNLVLELECRSTLTQHDIREHLLLAWASLRAHHSLLRARTVRAASLPPFSGDHREQKYFVVPGHCDMDKLTEEAARTLVFVEDQYPETEVDDFFRHATNTARAVGGNMPLARLFVLPTSQARDGRFVLCTMLVAGHCIADGLTAYAWNGHFIELLNQSLETIRSDVKKLLDENGVWQSLPKALEDLYPPIAGSRARQRWFWAVSRVLRHTRKVHNTALPNPLARTKPLRRAQRMQSKFDKVLDYSVVPPLNTFKADVTLSASATRRLQRMCKDVKASIGAGSFAYVGIAMMELAEERFGLGHASMHAPCVLGFPLNSRPFFGYQGQADSLMLAFSDGMALPFLPSDLPVEGRFRLLARHAQRHLSAFQKRPQTVHGRARLGSRSVPQILASSYMLAVEWGDMKLPESRKTGVNPQGMLMARSGARGTCGVSAIGSRAGMVRAGKYNLDGSREFAADFRDLSATVRVREGEFLVGTTGDAGILHFSVSYDGNAIDEEMVLKWQVKMQSLLEVTGHGKL